MSLRSLVLAALLLAAPATAQIPTLSVNASNSLCVPPPCELSFASISRGSVATFQTARGTWDPYFLLLSAGPVNCVSIPGLAGLYASGTLLAAEALPIVWTRVHVSGGTPCFAWLGSAQLLVPPQLNPGTQVIAQLLNFTAQTSSGAFSNAVTITIQ